MRKYHNEQVVMTDYQAVELIQSKSTLNHKHSLSIFDRKVLPYGMQIRFMNLDAYEEGDLNEIETILTDYMKENSIHTMFLIRE